MDASTLPTEVFGIQFRRKPQTNFGRFAEKVLGTTRLALGRELDHAVKALPKYDQEHDWLALEHCTLCVLEYFQSVDHLQELDSHFALYQIQGIVRNAWYTKYVALWFLVTSFPRRQLGILKYIYKRLRNCTLEARQVQVARKICAILDTQFQIAAAARHLQKSHKRMGIRQSSGSPTW
jgi:hypothetical protein